jgi:electron transfer flavoprotein alpha subunit
VSVGSEILTFSERADVGSELLAAARALGQDSRSSVVSLVVGRDGRDRAQEDVARGADKVLLAAEEYSGSTDSGLLLEALAQVVQATVPSIVLIGSTRVGGEVAARLAQRLGVASASECLTLELDQSGGLIVERLVYGGRFVAKRVLHAVPKIAAVQIKRFELLPKDEARRGEILEIPVQVSPSAVKVVEVKEPERSQVDIGKAEVIISAGRGVKSKDDLALLESLAHALGGELAGSRPLVELAWLSRDRQVGLSGRTVKPKLYVACGVSGQIEHIAGMRPARTIVAINTSPDAPIHHEADYSVVADLYEVIPAMIAALAQARGGAG